MNGGLVHNQLGPFRGPVEHGDVPYPGKENIVDKGYSDFITTKVRKKIFRVPDVTVDLAPTKIELPEPFLRGSVLFFRNGVLDILSTELNNLEVELTNPPVTGVNRELIEFEYLPAYIFGRNALKNKMMFTFSASRTLTDLMVLYSFIRIKTDSEVTLTLPVLTAKENGARVTFYREGTSNAIIETPGSVTIDNSLEPFTLDANRTGIELIYYHPDTRWTRIGRE